MEEKLEKISERLEALEREYHSDKRVVRAAAAVFMVLLLAFFGISLSQIRSHVKKAMEGTAIQTATQDAEDALAAIENRKTSAEEASEAINELRRQYDGEIVDIYLYRLTDPDRAFCFVDADLPGCTREPQPVFRAFAAKRK